MGTTIESSWENEQLKAELLNVKRLAKAALDAHDAEARALSSWENARENFSDACDEAKAYGKAAIAASKADGALRDAIAGV